MDVQPWRIQVSKTIFLYKRYALSKHQIQFVFLKITNKIASMNQIFKFHEALEYSFSEEEKIVFSSE